MARPNTNRIIAPCIAKLSDNKEGRQWYKVLHEIEYSINNIVNRSTGKSLSQIIFGIDQRGPYTDRFKDLLEIIDNPSNRDLSIICDQAARRINQSQQRQKKDYDR